jgi:hypothetical protein
MLPGMKLPSMQRLTEEALSTAHRFPLAMASGAIAAFAGILMVNSGGDEEFPLRLMYAGLLGLPLFVGLQLVSERYDWPRVARLLAMGAGVALLAVVYFLRPGWSDTVATERFFQLSLGLHLFVAVGPYLGVDERNGFWQYNMSLFVRFLLAAVFTAVLFAGLSVALLAIDNLFGLDVDGKWYGRLWFVLAFVAQPWLFLGGVPDDFQALEERTTYPNVLKIFAQYILAPIVALYLVILTVYLGKVLLTQEWPSGWIGWLVSSVATAGILSLLLLQPIRDREENRWVGTYARWFYVALIPSIAMLLMAIWKRIDQYGVTERRYYLVVLSLWLAGIALFYVIRRRGSIKVIPATLGLLAFLTIAGPWGAFAVSERSQVARLEGILEANGLLADGRLQPPSAEVSFADRREISAVVRYLAQTHGVEALDPWFDGGLAGIGDDGIDAEPAARVEADSEAARIVAAMGVEYVDRWAGVSESTFSCYVGEGRAPIEIGGYDYAIRDWNAVSDSVWIAGRAYWLEWDEDTAVLSLIDERGALARHPLEPVVQSAMRFRADSSGTGTIPAHVLMSESSGERARTAAWFGRISGRRGTGGTGEAVHEVESFTADLFLTLVPDSPAATENGS